MSCDRAALFDLAAGDLPHQATASLQLHVQTCASCQADLQAAQALLGGAAELQKPDRLDDETRAAGWQALAAKVAPRRRGSWTPDRRMAAWTAVAALLGLSVGAAYLLGREGRDAPAPELKLRQEPVAIRELPLPALPAPQPPLSPRTPTLPTLAPARPDMPVAEVAPPEALPAEAHPAVSHPHVAPIHEWKLACGGHIDATGAQAAIVRNLPHASEIRLEFGQIKLRVPHLQPGSTVQVGTDDAMVTVIGTEFEVDKTDQAATQVRVIAGTVWVQPRGRGREKLVLHAGDHVRVEGEAAWHRRLIRELDEAIDAGDLDLAVRRAFRTLDVLPQDESAAVRMRLGAIFRRQDRRVDAAAQYRIVADSAGPMSARDNALAALAWLAREAQHAAEERPIWELYAERFPAGLHRREALLRLVDLTCADTGLHAQDVRKALASEFAEDAAAQDELRRCGSGRSK